MPTPVERFEAKYIEDPETGCWIWTACRTRDGYGSFGFGPKRGSSILAHRFSYQEHVAPIPPGLNVLHRCDNPPCVNPDHLFLGTQADNVADSVAKGRWGHDAPKEDRLIRGKLTIEERAEIRRLYAEGGHSHKSLARVFGVRHQTVYYWLHRKDFDQLAKGVS